MKHELKHLDNPKKYHDPISIKNQDAGILINMLSTMLLIRMTEQRLALERKNGLIGGTTPYQRVENSNGLSHNFVIGLQRMVPLVQLEGLALKRRLDATIFMRATLAPGYIAF